MRTLEENCPAMKHVFSNVSANDLRHITGCNHLVTPIH
jgi:hypothetical protein